VTAVVLPVLLGEVHIMCASTNFVATRFSPHSRSFSEFCLSEARTTHAPVPPCARPVPRAACA